jgi:hypothetical protein
MRDLLQKKKITPFGYRHIPDVFSSTHFKLDRFSSTHSKLMPNLYRTSTRRQNLKRCHGLVVDAWRKKSVLANIYRLSMLGMEVIKRQKSRLTFAVTGVSNSCFFD